MDNQRSLKILRLASLSTTQNSQSDDTLQNRVNYVVREDGFLERECCEDEENVADTCNVLQIAKNENTLLFTAEEITSNEESDDQHNDLDYGAHESTDEDDEASNSDAQDEVDNIPPEDIPDVVNEKENEPNTNIGLAVSDTTQVGQPNFKRKRSNRWDTDSMKWSDNKNKSRREKGKNYFGRKKVENKITYNIPRQKRQIKEKCNCKLSVKSTKLKCHEFSEQERKLIFNKFWTKMTWNERKIYVCSVVEMKHVDRQRNRKEEENSRRTTSLAYYLYKNNQKLRVCKKMFLNTLSIGEWSVLNWKKADSSETGVENDELEDEERSSDNEVLTRKKVVRRKLFQKQKSNLVSFFSSLPKMESHYCRATSSKLYLEPTWKSKKSLYDMYAEDWCKSNNSKPLSIASFHHVFDDLHLSLFRPKKDECEKCMSFKTKNLSEEDYNLHQQKKEEARLEKENDKKSSNKVFTMDVQGVLLCPKSNVSSLYFKTKLITHNFTIFDIQTKDGYCFLWNETEGGVSADCYCSIITNFLTRNVIPSITDDQDIVIWSDGCTSQNRNVTLSNALLNIAILQKITIIQKYFEKGHSQMEADSMHATIERKMKNEKINIPADYIQICQRARRYPRPYFVQYLHHDYFKKFNDVAFYSSIRPGKKTGDAKVTDIHALKYQPDGLIFYKIRHTDNWNLLENRVNKSISVRQLEDLPRLYHNELPIKKKKYEHLQSLKNTLDSDYHRFYDDLQFVN